MYTKRNTNQLTSAIYILFKTFTFYNLILENSAFITV